MILAARDSTAVPLALAVTKNGGVAGLAPVVAIRDGASLTSYLDFADNTFKAAAWTTRQAAMTDLGAGFYARTLNPSLFTNLPAATRHLVVEYAVTAGNPQGVSQETINLVQGALVGGVVDDALDLQDALAVILAAVLGRSQNAGTAQETFKNPSGAATRAVVDYDASNNRTSVVLTPP